MGLGWLTIIDGSDNTIIDTIYAGNVPHIAAINPVSNKLYVGYNDAGGFDHLKVYDISNVRPVEIASDILPKSAYLKGEVNTKTNVIYFVNQETNNGTTIDVVDGKTDTLIKTLQYPFVQDPNSSAYSATYAYDITVNETSNEIYITTTKVSHAPPADPIYSFSFQTRDGNAEVGNFGEKSTLTGYVADGAEAFQQLAFNPVTGRAYIIKGIFSGGLSSDIYVIQAATPQTYSISGKIFDSNSLPVAGVTVSDDRGHLTITLDDGSYILTNLPQGTYTITPEHRDYKIFPSTRQIVLPPNAISQNFLADSIICTQADMLAENTTKCADTDRDGLFDIWETQGIDVNNDGVIDLNLANLGAKPNRKDIFVEVDWMSGIKSSQNNIKAALEDVRKAFGCKQGETNSSGCHNAPVWDEDIDDDGSQGAVPAGIDPGVNLILQVDEAVTASNSISFLRPGTGDHDDMYDYRYGSNNAILKSDGSDVVVGFTDIRDPDRICELKGDNPNSARFGTSNERKDANCVNIIIAKSLVFRYAIFGHNFIDNGVSTGVSQPTGNLLFISDDLVRTFVSRANTQNGLAGTFMHELGHTLGLEHGGVVAIAPDDKYNCKPNYFSVMNYLYQLPLADPQRPLDYSSWESNTLDESFLDENAGIKAPDNRTTLFKPTKATKKPTTNVPIDWNRNGRIDTVRVQADINNTKGLSLDNATKDLCKNLTGDATPNQTLFGNDDWKSLSYSFRSSVSYPYNKKSSP